MSNEFVIPLQSICASLPGALAATLMGFDGIPVETVERERDPDMEDVDVQALLVEFSNLIHQIQRSAQMFAAGTLEELSIASERLITIIRPLNDEYFVALAVIPGASTSKGRYLLRIHSPRLTAALS